MKIIETERLILRTWKDEDAEAYYQINQDLNVIEFLRGPMTMTEVKKFIGAANQCFSDNQYTLWALEEKATHTFIGFVGLWAPQWESHFTPCVEIGWRLGSQYWGKGYAVEAAKAVLNYGFNIIGLDEIVSFTASKNIRSIRVMEKIGMTRDYEGDFLYPTLPADHPLSQHVLYRILPRKSHS
jgi:RimJ/RimL family protein N-acetyltransferase